MSKQTKSIKNVAKYSILLAGEGKTECAFFNHIASLYKKRYNGMRFDTLDLHGKTLDQAVDYLIRLRKPDDYSRVVILVDTDRPIPESAYKRAKAKKMIIVGSIPCIEGLYLKTLGESVPNSSQKCKTQCKRLLPIDLTNHKDYPAHFPKELLEEKRKTIPELNALLDCFSFK